MFEYTPKQIERFWSNVKFPDFIGTNECWEWTGYKLRGYGKIGFGYTYYRAHRLAYELAYGIAPAGMNVCHHCDNPSCVNPSHLFLGTDADNVRDKVLKHRQVGPPPGEDHFHAILTTETVQAIRHMAQTTTHTHKEIADIFGISRRHASRIISRERWRHI